MKQPTKKTLLQFLAESNAIEDVTDARSLEDALKAWEYLIDQPELTVRVVLKTHKILMEHQPLPDDQKGFFRSQQVWVGEREGAPFALLPSFMSDWCWMSNHGTSADAIQQLHVAYEEIHPFLDGNGRTGRMFWNYQRLKANLRMDIIFEKDRRAYYDWFQGTQ